MLKKFKNIHTFTRSTILTAIALCSLVFVIPACKQSNVTPSDKRSVSFRLTIDPAVRSEPANGRLVVYLTKEGHPSFEQSGPAYGPSFVDPQPIFATNVRDMKPGDAVSVDDAATTFPVKLSDLPSGKYAVQAVLDMQRTESHWWHEADNIRSRTRIYQDRPWCSALFSLGVLIEYLPA